MTNRDQERRDALLRYISKVELQITKDYGRTCQMIGRLQELRDAVVNDKTFAWKDHPEALNKVRSLLGRFAEKTSYTLTVASTTAYKMGVNDGSNKSVEAYTNLNKKRQQAVTDIAEDVQRECAKNAHKYAISKRGGLTISDRVWNLTDGTEKEMEIAIQNSILQGGDADTLSREIRGYLKNPSSLFRRVRNPKTGLLELSQAAQNYHPGQGVYRSAYKNAMRLTRTEINQAYRTAETASYADNPLVTGYRIKLSNNHTTLYKGKRIPLVDICNTLAGEYPATFQWNGWHPQCRCILVPNPLSDNDLDRLIEARGKAIEEGRDPNNVLPKLSRIPDLPDNFIEWYKDNETRIKAARFRPIWVGARTTRRVNMQLTQLQSNTESADAPKGQPKMEQNKARTHEEIMAAAAERHKSRTSKQIADITDRWLDSREDIYTPDRFKRNGSYCKGEIRLDYRLFKMQKDLQYKVIVVKDNDEGSYHQGNKVVIANKKRMNESQYFRQAVIYHEFGHQLYDDRLGDPKDKLILKLNEVFKKYQEKFNDADYIKELAKKDMLLKSMMRRVMRADANKYPQHMDAAEQILNLSDTIKSLNPSYGEGHKTEYYLQGEYFRIQEFMAHASENYFIENKAFKKYFPDLYEDMKSIFRTFLE